MCSISTNATVDKQLDKLERSDDRDTIEKRLFSFAKESSIETAAILDLPICHMRRMPEDLKDIRKIQIGRHRVYFTGYHTQCSYKVVYIKAFKQSGKNDEDDRRFQKILASAICETPKRTIQAPPAQD